MNKNENSELQLKCSLSGSPSYKVGEPILVTFSIENQTGDYYQLLKWNTPLEKETFNFFIVEREGVRIPYDGRLVKRGNPVPESYVVINPGQTLSETIDLSTSYKFDKPGDYTITIKGKIHDAFKIAGDAKEAAKRIWAFQTFELTNEKISFKLIEGGEPMLTKGEKGRKDMMLSPISNNVISNSPDISPLEPQYQGGTPQQQDAVRTAHFAAFQYINLAYDEFAHTNQITNEGCKEWFGVYDEDRYDTVKTNLAAIQKVLLNETITYVLYDPASGCKPDDFAYTYKNTRKIWLCTQFWIAPAIGIDSQSGTIVHELTHAVSSTDDVDDKYGMVDTKNLAINYPASAINNAQSYEYFAELIVTGPHVVGQKFEGGIIFYIFKPGDPGYRGEGDVDGLIVSEVSLGEIVWFDGEINRHYNIPTSLGIGAGSDNTSKIIAIQGNPDDSTYAATLCRNYRGGGYTDWFLPSQDELNQLYLIRAQHDIAGFSDDTDVRYWSSSQYETSAYAWFQNLVTGEQWSDEMDSINTVRAVRAF